MAMRVPDSRPGSYVLVLQLMETCSIQVGRLGELRLRPGWFAYAGSALGPGGVAARCGHHRRVAARPHWHVDYLRAVCSLRAIWFSHDPLPREHQWFDLLRCGRGARVPMPGFGSSDCRCPSHLVWLATAPSFESFRRRAMRAGGGSEPIHQELIQSSATLISV